MRPIKCEPVYIESVWAGSRLTKIRQLDYKNIGICREICAYKGSQNKILNPEYHGLTFKELIEDHHHEMFGDSKDTQLIRVAYIDAIEDLSIQVHPNNIAAEKVGDFGKNESWYILDCDPGATIVVGTMITDKDVLFDAAVQGTLEKYVNKVEVKPGDFVMVPAHMLHACGKNMLAIEIGSFGGITYRIYDYGRPRGLDLEKGFAILDPDIKSELLHFPVVERTSNSIRRAIHHPDFTTEIIDICDSLTLETNGKYFILTCVDGNCEIICNGEEFKLPYTETILIPAVCEPITINGNCRLIRSMR